MLITQKLAKAFNKQVGSELGASNQYLHVAAWFDDLALPLTAKFFYTQSDEERAHALKFIHYIVDAGGKLEIPTVTAPAADLASAEEAVELCLKWELEVTRQINALMDQAIKENDHIAQEFLRWFVNEQLEEVNTMEALLKVVRRAGDQLQYLEEHIAHVGHPTEPGAA